MTPAQKWTSFYTMLRKDVVRIFRIWPQTFLPSVITSVLYFLIFGKILGERIGDIGGFSYIQFVVPGLVMLAVVTNAFTNVASTFFQAKFFSRNIDEVLVSPTPPWVLIAGFVSGGVVRGVLTGIIVLLVSVFFAVPPLTNIFVIALFRRLRSSRSLPDDVSLLSCSGFRQATFAARDTVPFLSQIYHFSELLRVAALFHTSMISLLQAQSCAYEVPRESDESRDKAKEHPNAHHERYVRDPHKAVSETIDEVKNRIDVGE